MRAIAIILSMAAALVLFGKGVKTTAAAKPDGSSKVVSVATTTSTVTTKAKTVTTAQTKAGPRPPVPVT